MRMASAELGHIHGGHEAEDRGDPQEHREEAEQVAKELDVPGSPSRFLEEVRAVETQPSGRLLLGKTGPEIGFELERDLILREIDEGGPTGELFLVCQASNDLLFPLELQQVLGDGRDHRGQALQQLKVKGRLIGRGAEEDHDPRSPSVDIDAPRTDGDDHLGRLQALELRMRNRDLRIEEEVVLAALAGERRLDLGSPCRERGASQELLEKLRKRAAGVEQDSAGAQELVNHGKAAFSLALSAFDFGLHFDVSGAKAPIRNWDQTSRSSTSEPPP